MDYFVPTNIPGTHMAGSQSQFSGISWHGPEHLVPSKGRPQAEQNLGGILFFHLKVNLFNGYLNFSFVIISFISTRTQYP